MATKLPTDKKLSDRFYTAPQVAELLEMHINTVYKLLKDGRLQGIKLSGRPRGRWRIPTEEIDRLCGIYGR